jgi:hypothetical protein
LFDVAPDDQGVRPDCYVVGEPGQEEGKQPHCRPPAITCWLGLILSFFLSRA